MLNSYTPNSHTCNAYPIFEVPVPELCAFLNLTSVRCDVITGVSVSTRMLELTSKTNIIC